MVSGVALAGSSALAGVVGGANPVRDAVWLTIGSWAIAVTA
jgi:hypothetical protein